MKLEAKGQLPVYDIHDNMRAVYRCTINRAVFFLLTPAEIDAAHVLQLLFDL